MKSPLPAYRRIMEFIRERIEKGDYGPGDRIPSENELARIFNVSRLTARRAIEKLADEGLLIRVPGLGTFVSELSKDKITYVGISIEDLSDTRGRTMTLGMVETLRSFSVYPILTQGGKDRVLKKLRELLDEGVKGLIISPFPELSKSGILDVYLSRNIPVVFIDRRIVGKYEVVPVVESDNFMGGRMLGEHLKKRHGVRRALFVTIDGFDISSVLERYEGFKEGLKGNVDTFVGKSEDISRELPEMVLKNGYDAIFFCHDLIALTGLTALLRVGVRIPEDVKIVSFDDRIVAKYTWPRLTTVRQDFEEMGKLSALILLKLMKGERVSKENKIPVELVVRESCGCEMGSILRGSSE